MKVPYDTMNYANGEGRAQLFRGSTALGLEQKLVNADGAANADQYITFAFTYLDSPSTTSATTYHVKVKSVDVSSYGAVQIDINDAQITVQEVD